ncbi:hypothetical protein [uncultured Enterobacter sp.]|uniref:hypothetical protein n=1 Tax=uncultured Enterobacter sp. TaxID=238202 RepID=UPI002599F6B0|nr:hypothetical protein [uncultured Enterobacter sp.]
MRRRLATRSLTPLSEAYIAGLRDYSVEEMHQRAVTGDDRCWSTQGLLDSVLPGHGGEIAPVIGFGISQDRDFAPAIVSPHGFSVEWLRLSEDHVVGRHLCPDIQVIMVFKAQLEVTWDEAILQQAREHSRCLDPDGYVADADILPATARRAGAILEKWQADA